MQNNREEDLSLLYRLLRKVNCLDSCVKFFGDYVKVKTYSKYSICLEETRELFINIWGI